MTTIYQKIQEEIKTDYYQQNFSNDGQRFVAWYLFNILRQDRNQTKDSITDGADDKQIDAIVIDDDKQVVYIIQGKFISGGQVDAQPLREVLSSWMQLRDLVRLQEVGNQKLQRKLSEVSKAFEDDYEVCFELITTASLTQSALNDLETFQTQLADISENEDFDATISVIDENELARRYELALETDNPQINYTVNLEGSKFMPINIAGTDVVIVALPLKEAVQIYGIKDGSLFQKNVRQSLGSNNAINKKIRQTILGDKHKDFFFFHNGITAICNRMEFKDDNTLKLYGLSVVNGCQSLNTILSCSERVKKLDETYVLFRFYEIPQRDRADLISINTNSQSAVKPRDLRSNDKRVLNLKRLFEQKFSQGYFITKRGEIAPPEKDKKFVIDLSDLGKYLIAWHSQRPNISYGETKIFDKYFEILFKRDYRPENIQALNDWMREVMKNWNDSNPLGFNETLLTMKAYAPFHHLYAISMLYAIGNSKHDRVPAPFSTWEKAKSSNMVDQIVKTAGRCLNTALRVASNRSLPNNTIFSPQNWIKSKQSLNDINTAIEQYLDMLPTMDGGEQQFEKLKNGLTIGQEQFEYRLQAD